MVVLFWRVELRLIEGSYLRIESLASHYQYVINCEVFFFECQRGCTMSLGMPFGMLSVP